MAAQLASDPRVDMVSFTGSTDTGRAIMAAAAPTLKKVFLELGGKSAAIVLDDADVASAARDGASPWPSTQVRAALSPPGCGAPRAYDEAVEAAAATMSSLGAGDPADPGTICGPVISAVQRDRILGYLALAEEEGGRIATGGAVAVQGGDLAGGFWIQPTVVAGLDNTARVAREEIFGPVLTVIPHDGDDDAVRIANDSPYGLSGSVESGSWSARSRSPPGSAPAPSASTAASGSAPMRLSAATSSPASAGRWASKASRSTSRPS